MLFFFKRREPRDDAPRPPFTAYTPGGGDAPRKLVLDGDERCDAVIVGGGFVGCSAALHATGLGVDTVLLEQNEIGWGSAGRNFGNVNPRVTKLEPENVVKVYGPVFGERLNDAGSNAPAFISELAARLGIDATIVRGGVMTGAYNDRGLDMLKARVEFYAKRGESLEYLNRAATAETVGGDVYRGSVIDRRAISVNPLALVRGMARAAAGNGARLYQNSAVVAIEPKNDRWLVRTLHGTVDAKYVLLCTNAYTADLWPGLAKTALPICGSQIFTKPIAEHHRSRILKGLSSLVDTRRLPGGVRLHPDGRLQIGGAVGTRRVTDPRVGKSMTLIRRLFPEIGPIEVEGWWSGWTMMGIHDGWRLHELAPGVLTLFGCNGRGVGAGTIFGRELARLVGGTPASELMLPITTPKSLPMYPFYRAAASIAIKYYSFRDQVEFRS